MRAVVIVNQLVQEQMAIWEAIHASYGDVYLIGPDVPVEPYFPSTGGQYTVPTVRVSPKAAFGRAGGAWKVIPNLQSTVSSLRPDLIHIANEPWALVVLQVLRYGIPTTIHGADNQFKFGRGIERYTRTKLLEHNLRRVRGYASWNCRGVKLAEAHGLPMGAPVLVSPSMTPRLSVLQNRDWDSEKIEIIFVGRACRPEKGLADLVEALLRLPERVRSQIVLRIIGTAIQDRMLERLPERLIIRTGRVAHVDAMRLLAMAHLTVVPSKTLSGVVEQFGRVVIESMAVGTPVLVTDSGALPEVVADAGLIVPEGSPDKLARNIEMLVGDRQQLARMSLDGHARFVATYAANKLAADMHSFWYNALRI